MRAVAAAVEARVERCPAFDAPEGGRYLCRRTFAPRVWIRLGAVASGHWRSRAGDRLPTAWTLWARVVAERGAGWSPRADGRRSLPSPAGE